MLTKGEYRRKDGTYGVLVDSTKEQTEIVLVLSGQVHSSFKINKQGEFSFANTKAKDLWAILSIGLKGCTAKNGNAVPFVLGTATRHEFIKAKTAYAIDKYGSELAGAEITKDETYVYIEHYGGNNLIPPNIPYIKLTQSRSDLNIVADEDEIAVRSVEEIALTKENVIWLKGKKYYIINDDEMAEKLFAFLDNYNGPTAYDTETSGLRINMFGKINSKEQKALQAWNEEHPDDTIRADKLVGIIFCVEKGVSYYFPAANRKFKNLYEDRDSVVRKATINYIRENKRKADPFCTTDMGKYLRDTADDDISSDVILMERVRFILENKHIVAHNGAFEWRVGQLYDIDTNLKDDTMIMHQIMYKFRSTTSNRGEPSSLKYLARTELGIDQWELGDFFPDFKEEKRGEVRDKAGAKKGKTKIDFSYMTYEGTRIYAPTDGDVTLQLYLKYKRDLLENHKEMEYLYNVEVIVSCAVAYMEFYGHRLDEKKISSIREHTRAEIAMIESQIRQTVGYSKEKEMYCYKQLKGLVEATKELEKSNDDVAIRNSSDYVSAAVDNLREAIAENEENQLNLGSPAQVGVLFYDTLQIPLAGEKRSVAKKEIKSLIDATNADGTPKYPVVGLYSEYKKLDTLMTKFFDNLPYFMYPGGFIFSSFGQISTATGRMSCSKPNAQQYPKAVTGIVVPREWCVMADADFSQIEYRVLVAMAGEAFLAKLFEDPDNDYHTLMASLMYGVPYASVTPKMRSDAKSFNFGIPYGMGIKSLARLLFKVSDPTKSQIEEAMEKYELYFKDQPNVRKFFEQVKEMARVNSYTKTFWNRYRYYSFTGKDGKESNARKASALRQAGNAVIQGCLHGDTIIQTKEFGFVKIKEVAGRSMQVWDGDKWSHGDITYSGEKQKCIVTFSTGQEFVCSPIHKFKVRSAKGNDRFIECQDLRGSDVSTNPHRVAANTKYEPSDFKYSSDWARHYKSTSNNARNVFVDSIGSSFEAGVVLGRLASDGSIIKRDVGSSYILQYVAEHEFSIVPKLMSYMQPLSCSCTEQDVREGRNEKVNRIYAYSASLVNEVNELDIKHQIHENIFMDTEILRGFLSGFFDGDGGISGKTITLTFGTQYEFEPMCRDIQKALLFFGVRSRYRKYDYRHVISIKTSDNQKFLDIVGFLNEDKQRAGRELKCIKDEKIFGHTLVVKSVEITDEYIDMYDVCNTDGGYYVADGVITHNTAADIFKISVARLFMYIRQNKLIGLLFIINMIHDEQLFEINSQKLNVQKVLADIGTCMQFKIQGFPPLFIGAGVGTTWAKAKDKMAEIHPYLLDRFMEEEANTSIFADTPVNPADVLKYYEDRVYEYRVENVREYLLNSDNANKDLHPAIGNLLNLQFSYGHNKNKEGLSDEEFTKTCLVEFIAHNNLNVDPELFKAQATSIDVEEDTGYDDDEDEFDEDESFGEGEALQTEFKLLDESNKMYGVTLQDIIGQFGYVVSISHRACGIDMRNLGYKDKDIVVDFLLDHLCDEEADDALEVIYLQDAGILFRSGLWVNGIEGSALAAKLRIKYGV